MHPWTFPPLRNFLRDHLPAVAQGLRIITFSILFTFLVLLMSSVSAFGGQARFYIGPYTNEGKSQGIYTALLDTETGALTEPVLAAPAKHPSFLALSPSGKVLYAAMESGGGAVGAFLVREDGTLQELNVVSSGGSGACHVWVDATGRNVLVANYTDGSIAIIRANEDGSLGERTAYVKFTGSGPDPKRQTKPYGHAVYTDPTNRFVYACDLGSDKVWGFHLDAAAGTLTPMASEAGVVPPGSGPRHLAIHPTGEHLYVANEMGLSVTHFSRDTKTGALKEEETFPTMPEGAPREGVTVAEIHLHPSGKFLYVSNRRRDTIAVYAVRPDGTLAWAEEPPAGVKVPRGFHLDPSGRWLIAAGQEDDTLAVHEVDEDTGMLTLTPHRAAVGNPVCILFAPIPTQN